MSQSFPIFNDHGSFEEHRSGMFYCPSTGICLMFCSWLGVTFQEKEPRGKMPFSSHDVKGTDPQDWLLLLLTSITWLIRVFVRQVSPLLSDLLPLVLFGRRGYALPSWGHGIYINYLNYSALGICLLFIYLSNQFFNIGVNPWIFILHFGLESHIASFSCSNCSCIGYCEFFPLVNKIFQENLEIQIVL